jgi:hypothetical protein
MSENTKKPVLNTCPYCQEDVELDKHMVYIHDYVRAKGQKEWDTRVAIHPCVYLYEYENGFRRIGQSD